MRKAVIPTMAAGPWPHGRDAPHKPFSPGPQLLAAQLVGAGGRPGHEIRHGDAAPHEHIGLLRAHPTGDVDESVSDAGAVKGQPEAVAGMGEGRVDGRGP